MHGPVSRSGFTLVEVLVVLVVSGILLAVLLPAIQHVRESARVTECRTRLQQLGRAVGNFEARTGFLPPADGYRYNGKGDPSPHYFLLADIDQQTVAAAAHSVPDVNGDPRLSRSEPHKHVIPVFLCPSDGGESGTNYRFNLGADVRGLRAEKTHRRFGPVGIYPGRRVAEITDGLSFTAMASESLISVPERPRFDVQRDSWAAGWSAIDLDKLSNEFVLATTAAAGAAPAPRYRYCGLVWASDHLGHVYYNHVVPPNSDVPNSIESAYYNSEDDLHRTSVIVGIHKAASVHKGGVNVLFLDGAVRQISESIDNAVWQANGTAALAD